MARLFLVIVALAGCSCFSLAQGSRWIVTLANHQMIDSLVFTHQSGDSLKAERNGIPFIFSIDELAEIRGARSAALKTGAVIGAVVGFVSFEIFYEIKVSQLEKTNNNEALFPTFPEGALAHLLFDIAGSIIGMSLGILVGVSANGEEVYRFSQLSHSEKIDLLESVFESDNNVFLR